MSVPIPITDFRDPRIDVFRDVRDRDLRGREQLFMAESELVVRRLLRTPSRLAALLLSRHKHEILAELLTELPADVPVYVTTVEMMSEIAGFHVHRGVLAVGHRPPAAALAPDAAFRNVPPRGPVTMLAAQGITNVDNMGALFRNAAAFGAHGVLLDDSCCDPLYRKAIRVSMGHALSVPYGIGAWPAALTALRDTHDVTLLAAEVRADAAPLWTLDLPSRLAIVLGAEGAGLDDATVQACDGVACIPMAPGVASVNVAVASAVFLYEWQRRHADPVRNEEDGA